VGGPGPSRVVNMAGLAKLLAVSLVVMGLSHTLTRERLFEPLRRRMGGKDTWLGYLVSCPYCVSHWIAFVLVPLTGVYYVDVAGWLGPIAGTTLRWFLSSVLVAMLAAFFRVIFYFVDESQGLVRRRQRTEEEEAKTQAETRRALRGRGPDAKEQDGERRGSAPWR
jgi:uncharacterized membrane protein